MRPFRPIAPGVAFCLFLCAAGARGQTPDTARPAMDPSLAEATVFTPRPGNEVALDASYYMGPLWAAGWRCIARRERERWTVECHGTWVSLAPDQRTVPYVLRHMV